MRSFLAIGRKSGLRLVFKYDLNGVLTVGDFYQRAEGEGTQIIFI